MSAGKPVVVIVDDVQSLCEALQHLLATVGLKAQTFGSAQEFMSGKRPDVPGCLFLDVRLPGLSRLDLRREVANMDPAIAIVMIGGHAEMPMTVQAVKAGAVEILTKPFRDQQVLDPVQQAILRNRTARQRRAEYSRFARALIM